MSAARQRAGDKELPLGAQDGLEMRLLRTRMCCSRVMEGPQRHIVQVDRGAAQRRRSGAERWGRVAAACIAHRCCTCHAAVFARISLPQGRKFAAPTNGVSRHQVVRDGDREPALHRFPCLPARGARTALRHVAVGRLDSDSPRAHPPRAPPRRECTRAPSPSAALLQVWRKSAAVRAYSRNTPTRSTRR